MVISPVTIGLTSAPTEPATSAGGCGCGGCGCGASDTASATASDTASATTSATAPAGTTTAYAVEGMTCGHCVSAVTEELTAVAGVDDVTVELVVGGRSTVTVRSTAPLDVVDVRAALDEAGYTLVGQD